MGHYHALGCSGGTGSVDDVGGVVSQKAAGPLDIGRVVRRGLLEAIEAFDTDPLTRTVFPKEFVPAYVTMKLVEWEAYHSRVSEWERETYLTMF